MHTKSILFVASLFGVAVAAGCGSSSSGSTATTDDGGTTDDGSTSSSSSSGGEAGISLACASAADCKTAGQVCCGTFAGMAPGTACQAGPCPPLPVIGLPVQLCKMSTECTGGATCGAPTNTLLAGILMGMQICNAPAGGEGGVEAGGSSSGGTDGGSSSGSSTEGGSEGGSSSGGSEGGSDAPTGG